MCWTKAKYADYEARFTAFLEREQLEALNPGSATCSECKVAWEGDNCPSCNRDREAADEASFSWQPCECCLRPLGGDRYPASGVNTETKDVQEYSVCVDCYYYSAYGRLDDTTMMEVEDDKGEPDNG